MTRALFYFFIFSKTFSSLHFLSPTPLPFTDIYYKGKLQAAHFTVLPNQHSHNSRVYNRPFSSPHVLHARLELRSFTDDAVFQTSEGAADPKLYRRKSNKKKKKGSIGRNTHSIKINIPIPKYVECLIL